MRLQVHLTNKVTVLVHVCQWSVSALPNTDPKSEHPEVPSLWECSTTVQMHWSPSPSRGAAGKEQKAAAIRRGPGPLVSGFHEASTSRVAPMKYLSFPPENSACKVSVGAVESASGGKFYPRPAPSNCLPVGNSPLSCFQAFLCFSSY